MARMTVDGFEMLERQINRADKIGIRRIVEAGARAAEAVMADATRQRGHVRTGGMLASIGMNEYREFLGGGSVDVYPQGEDKRGERQATKAYVINYGRGGAKGSRMGDRFITGNEKKTEQAVVEAMQAESDRLIAEING